jgi:hypothetical protein
MMAVLPQPSKRFDARIRARAGGSAGEHLEVEAA